MKENFRKIYQIILLLMTLVAAETAAQAADVYMSVTDTQTSKKSTTGNWSHSNCYSNLEETMTARAYDAAGNAGQSGKIMITAPNCRFN